MASGRLLYNFFLPSSGSSWREFTISIALTYHNSSVMYVMLDCHLVVEKAEGRRI